MSIAKNPEFYKKQNSLGTLRFITCGNFDEKRPLSMLYEDQLLFDDLVENLKKIF